MQQELVRVSVLSIQNNKNQKRVWIEGSFLTKAGFENGTKITIHYLDNSIQVEKSENGERTVSGKKYPIIDINNSILDKIFNGLQKVKVSTFFGKILITKSKIEQRKQTALKDRSCGSVFSSGGLLDEAAKQEGYLPKFAIEINSTYADVFQQNHSGTMHNCDIAEVDFDTLPQVELLTAGIPCEPYSRINRKEIRETCQDKDLAMFFLMVVERTNPRTIVLEEVPVFLTSEIGKTTIKALERLGYNVKSKIITGHCFGQIEERKRAVIIASYDEIDFPADEPKTRTAKEFLIDPSDSSLKWFDQTTKPWLWKSWNQSKKNGNKFFAPIITEESTSIPAITKRYHAIQQTGVLVKHPTEEKYRLLTESEIRKIKAIPESYFTGDNRETKYAVMGQGVLIHVFARIFQHVMGAA